MFFYLSFLRPPPIQAAPYGTISITPQISNDLRTEPFDGSQDLYYSWSLDGPKPLVTKANKFTTWRLSNSYKEIPVPVPPGVREGQRWRLIIMGQAQTNWQLHPESVDLSTTNVGQHPFPVMSMPILFMGRGSKGASKQEMIERTYLVPCRGEDKKMLARLSFTEKTSFDLDKKIWDSGIGLSSWLVHLQENATLGGKNPRIQELRDCLFSEEPRNILELGAGIGILSIALAVLRSRPTAPELPKDRIIATDVDSAMPLLEENISSNSQYYQSASPEARVLDWDDEELPEGIKNIDRLDAIVMADVTYNTASFASLCRTLSRTARLGSKYPVIFLGYKERDEGERSFWGMAAQMGIDFEQIGAQAGAGGAPVEIWVGHVREQ
ncbi:putative methyltransferase-domain-containing protein [Flammula alnicola]|nr:putative methyltransferase-domain-containing protein [Flammula alnicola]